MKTPQAEIDRLAKIIWNYMLLNQRLHRADVILVLGSSDIRVAERTAELYKNGLAPLIVVSGGTVNRTKELFETSEAERFEARIVQLGVSSQKVLAEKAATNTGENILFALKLLAEHNVHPKSFLLVTKPYMERRAVATFFAQTTGLDVQVASPLITYDNYEDEISTRDHIINTMVGDLERIKVYPKQGLMIHQEIPKEVWAAFEQLVTLGYNKRLVAKQ